MTRLPWWAHIAAIGLAVIIIIACSRAMWRKYKAAWPW